MPDFNEDNYIKRVLSPAAEAFKRDGRLPDVFERYDLPIETVDGVVIELAIKRAMAFWNKTKNNPRYANLLAKLLQEVEQSRRTLKDDEARRKLREIVKAERRVRAEARFAALDKSLELIAGKGFITEDEKKRLTARFTNEGLSEKEIHDRIRVPVKTIERARLNEGLPKTVRDQIRGNLAVLGKRDLHEFLGAAPLSPKEKFLEAYRLREIEWRPKPNDHLKAAANTLLGIVKTHLVNGDPARYEEARAFEALEKLRPEVELAASDRRIDREEFQAILRRAVTEGVNEKDAERYILALAEELGAAVELTSGEEMIACANCKTAYARKSSPDRCTRCGESLWIKCPKCGKRTPACDRACGDCGFVIANLPRFELLLREAQLALDADDLMAATVKTQEAGRLWADHPNVVALLAKLQLLRRGIEQQHKQLGQALAERRLLAARRIAEELLAKAPNQPGHEGKDAQYWQREIDRRTAEVESLIARARAHERNRQTDEAVVAYQEALRLAADADEARRGMSRCPPAPPPSVRADPRDDHALVEWTPSPSIGEIEYVVLGKRDSAPISHEDGQTLGRTTDTEWRDKTQAPGSTVCYAVFAERGGARSRLTTTKALLVASDVESFDLEVKDGVVQGSWQFNAVAGRVRVFRKEGAPPAGLEGEEIKLTGPNYFVDRAVRMGRIYYYRALVEYHDHNGALIFTPGRVQGIRPEAPPLPVDRFEIAPEQSRIRFRWTPPASGAVRIYRLSRKPQWAFGAQIRARELAGLGAPASGASDREAYDPAPPSHSLVYYAAVTVSGDAAVAGAIQSYISAEDVAELSAHDFGHYLQLQWRWPDGCQSAAVAWRPDAYPHGADDPKATSRRITKGEYERQGGFRIERPASQPYRFAVYAAAEFDGEMAYGAGARGELRANRQLRLEYSIERPAWYQRGKPWRLILKAAEDVYDVPELALVARARDLQPLRIEDGALLATFDPGRLYAGKEERLEFSMDGAPRPAYLRLFFREPSAYERFQLIDPPPNELKVR